MYYTIRVDDAITPCPNDPCLYRYLFRNQVCFVLQYVDDALLAGDDIALDHLEKEFAKHFQCKFTKPKDFLGLDLHIEKPGDIRLSMRTFTSKMETVLGIHDPFSGEILKPGRTDKKVNKNDAHEPNEQYQSHVGSLNWLTMGLRYDMAFTTKELSRVLCAPTSLANQLVQRALVYAIRTKDAYLHFSHGKMQNYTPPKTRKKPTDTTDFYNTDHNTSDGITHVDDNHPNQTYRHKGPQLTLVCQTDIDLAGQPDTRQSTSVYVLYLNGCLFHWRAHTEKIIIKNTTAGECISLSRGNTACKFVRDLLHFMGNTQQIYYLYTDSQSAEHLATQPNMTDNSRSIDIRHHEIKQDYLQDGMRVGGVCTKENTADILTQHAKHCSHLHILSTPITANTITMNATFITKKEINKRRDHASSTRQPRTTTKRQRQKQRQRHWDTIVAERKVCRHLGIKHNTLTQTSQPTSHHTASTPFTTEI